VDLRGYPQHDFAVALDKLDNLVGLGIDRVDPRLGSLVVIITNEWEWKL
jgi:hypothetical protein